MSRLVTLTGPAWYRLGDIVIGSTGMAEYLHRHEPTDATAQRVADATRAEAGYARLRPDVPTVLTDEEHASLTMTLAENLRITDSLRQSHPHPALREGMWLRFIALDAARDQLAASPQVDPTEETA